MRDMRVKVIHIDQDIYDIFWGLGWNNHSRVQIIVQPDVKPKFVYMGGFVLPFHARIATSKYLRLPN